MTEQPTTQHLVSRAKKGDRQALEQIFSRLYADFLQAARLRLGPALRARLDSIDVVQSVYLEAYKDLGQFRGEGSFRGWMLKILENKIRDQAAFQRAAKRDVRKEVALDQDPSTPRPTLTPSRKLLASEARELLEESIDRLPANQRDVIVYRHYLQMSWKEVGDKMDRSEAAAKMLFQRAIQNLKELYKGSR